MTYTLTRLCNKLVLLGVLALLSITACNEDTSPPEGAGEIAYYVQSARVVVASESATTLECAIKLVDFSDPEFDWDKPVVLPPIYACFVFAVPGQQPTLYIPATNKEAWGEYGFLVNGFLLQIPEFGTEWEPDVAPYWVQCGKDIIEQGLLYDLAGKLTADELTALCHEFSHLVGNQHDAEGFPISVAE